MTEIFWKVIPGRCGACRKFECDFGEGEVAYGHCGVKPRIGALGTKNYRCDAYRPMEETRLSPAGGDSKARFDPWDTALDHRLEVSRGARSRPGASRTRRSENSSESAEFMRQRDRERRDSEPIAFGDNEMNRSELRELIEEALDDALQLRAVDMLPRFEGGTVTVTPGTDGTQAKEIPIDVFFRKIIAIRESLRVLEQKVNSSSSLSDAEKVQMQQYVTRCYGTLTTFNFLFKNKEDIFSGNRGEG